MKAPHGHREVLEVFGDPTSYIRPDGGVFIDWERRTLGMCDLPAALPLSWDRSRLVHRVRCHVLLVPTMANVFRLIYESGDWPLLDDFGGCYAWRTNRNDLGKLSLHCWGAAIDLNTTTNKNGTTGNMPPIVIQAFESQGFSWGGRFGHPDPMHFQFATGY